MLRFLQVFALGTWVGAILYLSFVVAPGAFATLPSRDLAGKLVGLALSRLHWMGIAAGVVCLAAAVAERRSFAALGRPTALAVMLMIVLTGASQCLVSRRMMDLRQQMGSVDATPHENPLRIEFDRLHQLSVRLECSILIFGIGALYYTLKQTPVR